MFNLFNSHVTFYTSYLGFNYVNTIGFIPISLYIIQLVSGLQLSLYYNYSLSYYAFDTIQFIMKDVNIGYIIRISHIVGSSFYMLFLRLHLLRGLFIKLFFYSFIYSLNHSFSFYYTNFTHSAYSIAYFTYCDSAYSKVSCLLASCKLFVNRCVTPDMLVNLGNLSLFSNFYFLPFQSNQSFSIESFNSKSLTFPYSNSKSSFNSITFQSIPFQSNFVNSFYFTFYYVYFIGIIIFLISIAVSFIGYTLVFGNSSYYGVIVILGLVSSFPSLIFLILQFLSFLLLFVASVLLLIFFFL